MRKLDLVGMKYPIGCLEQRSVMVFLRFLHHWNHLQSIRNPLVSWNHHLKTYLHGLHHFLRLTFPNRVIILMKTGRPRQPKPSVRSARVPNRSPSHSGRITEPKPKPAVRSVRAPRASLHPAGQFDNLAGQTARAPATQAPSPSGCRPWPGRSAAEWRHHDTRPVWPGPGQPGLRHRPGRGASATVARRGVTRRRVTGNRNAGSASGWQCHRDCDSVAASCHRVLSRRLTRTLPYHRRAGPGAVCVPPGRARRRA